MSKTPVTDDAYSFAVKQLKKPAWHAEPWPPGLLIDIARLAGIEFQDERQWGRVFTELARDGYIKRAGLFPRASSNGSVRPGWQAC
jgi:hypothetical protein